MARYVFDPMRPPVSDFNSSAPFGAWWMLTVAGSPEVGFRGSSAAYILGLFKTNLATIYQHVARTVPGTPPYMPVRFDMLTDEDLAAAGRVWAAMSPTDPVQVDWRRAPNGLLTEAQTKAMLYLGYEQGIGAGYDNIRLPQGWIPMGLNRAQTPAPEAFQLVYPLPSSVPFELDTSGNDPGVADLRVLADSGTRTLVGIAIPALVIVAAIVAWTVLGGTEKPVAVTSAATTSSRQTRRTAKPRKPRSTKRTRKTAKAA